MSETDCKKIIDGKLETDRGTRRRKRDIHHKRKTAKDRQREKEVVARWLVPSVRKVAGSNPNLAATQRPWPSTSLVVACRL